MFILLISLVPDEWGSACQIRLINSPLLLSVSVGKWFGVFLTQIYSELAVTHLNVIHRILITHLHHLLLLYNTITTFFQLNNADLHAVDTCIACGMHGFN